MSVDHRTAVEEQEKPPAYDLVDAKSADKVLCETHVRITPHIFNWVSAWQEGRNDTHPEQLPIVYNFGLAVRVEVLTPAHGVRVINCYY